MGCDIHLHVEHIDHNGRWWKCKEGFQSSMYDKNDKYFSQDQFKDCDSPWDCRSYVVFAYLADVRNGQGFAGCDTGNSIVPIAEPRGLPHDCSLTVKDESDEWDCDGHIHGSHSANSRKHMKMLKKLSRFIEDMYHYLNIRCSKKRANQKDGVVI